MDQNVVKMCYFNYLAIIYAFSEGHLAGVEAVHGHYKTFSGMRAGGDFFIVGMRFS